MATKVLKAEDVGGDVLLVTGTVGDGIEAQAFGWVSALKNHFGSDANGPDGHRLGSATPRLMTAKEKLAYCKRLLEEQNPTPPAPTDLGISG